MEDSQRVLELGDSLTRLLLFALHLVLLNVSTQ